MVDFNQTSGSQVDVTNMSTLNLPETALAKHAMVCCHGCIGATFLGMLRIVPSGCKGKGQDHDLGHHHLNIELLCRGNNIHDADRILSDG